jgi:Tol biopolymer transport system component
MMVGRWLLLLILCLASVPGAALAQTACTLDRATGTTVDAKPFLSGAYGIRWNHATNRLLFMQKNAQGYDQIYTASPTLSNRKALTDGRAGVPQKHNGMAYWHPSGRYVLFEAQKPEWHGMRMFGNKDYAALPGFGCHDDLWLITADGSRSWQLTHDPDSSTEGELLPVFSPNGKHVAWSCRQPSAPRKLSYAIKVADFIERPQPHLANIRAYRPGGDGYFETGSFSSDGKSLMYTSSQDTHNFWLSQIYRLNLADGSSTRLTQGVTYNEHPTVVKTPTGDWVVYMSSKDVRRSKGHLLLGTDWWAVRPDGTGTKRLTWMNQPGNPENNGTMQVACYVAPSPRGDFMLGDVQDSLTRQTGMVRVVHFTR